MDIIWDIYCHKACSSRLIYRWYKVPRIDVQEKYIFSSIRYPMVGPSGDNNSSLYSFAAQVKGIVLSAEVQNMNATRYFFLTYNKYI